MSQATARSCCRTASSTSRLPIHRPRPTGSDRCWRTCSCTGKSQNPAGSRDLGRGLVEQVGHECAAEGVVPGADPALEQQRCGWQPDQFVAVSGADHGNGAVGAVDTQMMVLNTSSSNTGCPAPANWSRCCRSRRPRPTPNDYSSSVPNWPERFRHSRTMRNNAHVHVLAALRAGVQEIPFTITGLDFDNGTELLNKAVIAWAVSGRSTSPVPGRTRRTTRPRSSRRTTTWSASTASTTGTTPSRNATR